MVERVEKSSFERTFSTGRGGKKRVQRIDITNGSFDVGAAVDVGLDGVGLSIPEGLG